MKYEVLEVFFAAIKLGEVKMTVGLCLLTWNEIEGCRNDVPRIDKSKFDQVYCIDGGSTDGTWEYLSEQGIEVYHQSRKGYNSACKDAALRCRCDAFIIFHPKGTVPVENTYKFRRLFEKGYEFIVAGRMGAGAYNEEDDKLLKPRKWFVQGLGFVARILYKREGNTVCDVLHGFRGMTVFAFQKMAVSDFPMSFDIETCCRAYKFKIRRIEFPVRETARIAGTTHFKALPSGWNFIKYMLWELIRKD